MTNHSDRAELERRYIASTMTPGIGGATLKGLLVREGGIDGLWDALDRSDAPTTVQRISAHWAGEGRAAAERVRAATLAVPGTVVVWEDPEYPAALREVSNPPPVLYVRGDIGRLTQRALAIVGTTDPLPGFARVAGHLARECAVNGIHVVSGLARGIDSSALLAAVEEGVPSFAVVGHGIDFEYPASSARLYAAIAQTGAVISQFPTGHPPQRWTFPMRNEVMCTLAYGTLIVQAHEKDGSLIQADFSFKHGRDVFVYDGNQDLPDNGWLSGLVERGARVFHEFPEVFEIVAQRHSQFAVPPAPKKVPTDQMLLFGDSADSAEGRVALLVDIDGVVADTRHPTATAMREALARVGATVPSGQLAGRSPFVIAREAGLDWRSFRPIYDAALDGALATADLVFPEMRTILSKARERGFLVGAVTSQPRRRMRLMLKDDAALFDEIVTYNDTPRRPKPAPDGIELALKRLGADRERALYVGDSHVDVLAARAAKVVSVAALWGYESAADLSRYSPDHIAASPTELDELLGQLVL